MSAPSQKRALLAWQIGDGRGHITKLRIIGEALTSRGVSCSAALIDLEHAAELKHVTTSIVRVPRPPYFHHLRLDAGYPPAATYGEFLGDLGFASSRIVSKHLGYWRDVMISTKPQIVIAEQAPTALLAARSLKIPTVALGTTYTLPPTNLKEFPILLDEFIRCKWSEADMCAEISAAVEPFGLPSLSHLAELYTSDLALPVGIHMLDPYADVRVEPRLPPRIDVEAREQPWTLKRDEVFVYLSTSNRSDAGIADALARLRVPLRVYIAGTNPEHVHVFRSRGIRVEQRPVRHKKIVRSSRIMFHSGSYGTMCLGIRGGIPQVTAPQQLEQLYNGRRLAREGGGYCIEPNDGQVYFDRIMELYESRQARREAIELAERTNPEFAGALGDSSAELVMRFL